MPTRWGSGSGVLLTGQTRCPPGGDQTQVCRSWGGHGAHQVGIRPRCVAHRAGTLNHQVGIRPGENGDQTQVCRSWDGHSAHQVGIRPRCVAHGADMVPTRWGSDPGVLLTGWTRCPPGGDQTQVCCSWGGHGAHQVGIRPRCVAHGVGTVPTRWGSDPGVSLTGWTRCPPGGDQTQVCRSRGGHGAHQVGIRPRCVAHGVDTVPTRWGSDQVCRSRGGHGAHQVGIRPRCVAHGVDTVPTRWGSDPGVSLTGRTRCPPGGDQT